MLQSLVNPAMVLFLKDVGVFAQTILFTLKSMMGTSKIIIGPAVRNVLPQDVVIVSRTIFPLGQLNLVKVCGIGKF